MKKIILLLICSLSVSCKKNITEKDLSFLNGYWEIEKVILPDNSVKEYKINTTFDYIELKDNKGFRKKVYPKLIGNFQASDDSETFEIIKNAENWQLNYQNDSNKWQEVLETLSENEFSVKNQADIRYFYKRIFPSDYSVQ